MTSKPLFFRGNSAERPRKPRIERSQAPAGYAHLVVGPDTRIVSVTPKAGCPFRFSDEVALGKPITAFVHPDDQPVLLRLMTESAQNPDYPYHAQIRFGSSDDHRWVLAVVNRRLGQERGDIDIELVSTRTPEEEIADLVERESRWNYAIVGSELGVWDHNFRTNQYFYSDIWKAMRGIPAEEDIDANFDNWLNNVHPEDRERLITAVAGQNAGDERYQVYEYRERHRDGHFIWIECRGAVVEWDEDGNPIRVVGTDIDITRRKEDEAKLEKLSHRLEMALDNAQIGVFEGDPVNRTVEWDENIRRIFGIGIPGQLVSSDDWENSILPEDRERTVNTVVTNVERGLPFRDEYRIRRPDGTIRYIRSNVVPFVNVDGETRVIGSNWDVTEDMLLRQELANAKELAEQRNRELEEVHARIRHNALHDYLTGLPNRRYLEEFLERETDVGAHDRRPLSVLHIDLDRFKQINDTLGHEAGDVILNEATKVLRGLMRGNDFVARIGGDEFAFVSRELSTPRRIAALADRIIREMSKPVPYKGHFIRVGASVGIALAETAAIQGKQLLLNADIALYRAKSRGRNRQEFFSQETQNEIIHTKQLSDEILGAIEKGEFIPYYQPQFHARDLSLAGMETLVRWNHPERGIITPDRFLPVATDLDVVSTIDGFVLEKALVDFEAWRADKLDISRISVNVSARRLDDPQLIRKLKTLTFSPGSVAFELLESIFLDDHDENTAETLKQIRELGIEIEIDDFGTGHASIISLMKIAPNVLKIDRELVRTLPHSEEQRRLVASIVEIGKSLNIKVLAEGVETRDHVRILQQVGCDILQGYGLARPMPASAIPGFLRGKSWLDS